MYKKTRQSGHVEVFAVLAVILVIVGFVGFSFWKSTSSNAGGETLLGTSPQGRIEAENSTNMAYVIDRNKSCIKESNGSFEYVKKVTPDWGGALPESYSVDGIKVLSIKPGELKLKDTNKYVVLPVTKSSLVVHSISYVEGVQEFKTYVAEVQPCDKALYPSCTITASNQPFIGRETVYKIAFQMSNATTAGNREYRVKTDFTDATNTTQYVGDDRPYVKLPLDQNSYVYDVRVLSPTQIIAPGGTNTGKPPVRVKVSVSLTNSFPHSSDICTQSFNVKK